MTSKYPSLKVVLLAFFSYTVTSPFPHPTLPPFTAFSPCVPHKEDGILLGIWLERSDGASDGIAEGKVEGISEGEPDGTFDGTGDGNDEGLSDGASEGALDGSSEGPVDGVSDGTDERVHK